MQHEIKSKDCSLGGTSDLTVIAPIKKGFVPALDAVTYKTRVKRVLSALHAGRANAHEFEAARLLSDAVERVGRIHSVRIAVLEPEDQVLLAVTFDGAWESYVRVIWQKVARLLDLIFCNTEGYKNGWLHSYEEWGRWLRSAQAETSFLYATPGLTVDDTKYLRMQERLERREADADLLVTRIAVPTTEEVADRLFTDGRDPTNLGFDKKLDGLLEARPAVFRQGLRSLVGLYRLADVYPPGTEDGDVLLRAAHELLPDFRRLLVGEEFLQTGWDRAQDRFDEQVAWLSQEPVTPPARQWPPLSNEPTLTWPEQIQGGILEPYFGAEHGALLLLAFKSSAALSALLDALEPTTRAHQGQLRVGSLATNIAFSVEGLRLAGLTDGEIEQLPAEFVQGMERRASVLGDVRANHPRRWRLPVRNWNDGISARDLSEANTAARVPLSTVHAVLQVRRIASEQSDGAELVHEEPSIARQAILDELDRLVAVHAGVMPLSLQWMSRQRSAGKIIEHFGFQDGDSDPVLRKAQAGTFFSNQVHPGEALIGYPNAADAVPPMPGTDEWIHDLLRNGSFLVVRKLRQDIGQLEAVLEKAVAEGTSLGGPTPTREDLLAKMMGRWPTGHDKAGQPLVGLPASAANPNDFWYASDADGQKCPLHAHIRRANPRMSVPFHLRRSMVDGARPPRLFRRGMSYGPPHDRAEVDPEKKKESLKQERGLVFMAYNASIGEQFEVVQRWLAGSNSSAGFSGQGDPFLGQAEPGRPRYFRFEDKGQTFRMELDGDSDLLAEPQPMVRLEWGGYFLTPSLGALELLQARADKPSSRRPRICWSPEQGEEAIRALRELEACEGFAAAADAWKAALEDPEAAADFTTASIWSAIRTCHGGVLQTPYGVLVATKDLVDRVLLDSENQLSSASHLNRMRESFGAIYLGLDGRQEDGQYEQESLACNRAILALDAADTYKLALECTLEKLHELVGVAKDHAQRDEAMRRTVEGATPRNRLHWELTLEVRELIEHLLATFCEEWFGLSAAGGFLQRRGFRWTWKEGDPPCYPGHFMAPSRYIFQPHPHPQVEAIGARHGKAMREAVEKFLGEFGATIQRPVTRAVLDTVPGVRDAGFAARTIVGAMMGMVPTVDGNLRRVMGQWLGEGTLWSLRAELADAAGKTFANRVNRAFVEAMQSRPAPDTLWRTAKTSFEIGGVKVNPGDIVVAGLASAAQESLEAGKPDLSCPFGGDRRKDPHPVHACPGYQPAVAMMQGFAAALVQAPLPLRAGPGPLTISLDGYADFAPPAGEIAVKAALTSTMAFAKTSYALELEAAALEKAALVPVWTFGDSWLAELPFFPELIGSLPGVGYEAAYHGYAVRGRTLEEMSQVVNDLARELQDESSGLPRPAALLMGGGGNDIVRAQQNDPRTTWLYRVLNDGAANAKSALNEAVLGPFIDGKLAGHYTTILSALTRAPHVPIFIHAYDFPIPDGRPASFLGEPVAGPWLRHVFAERHMTDRLVNREVMKLLIQRLNTMAERVAGQFAGVHYLKLTETLVSDPANPHAHEALWDNELHPTKRGYGLLAQKIADKLASVGVAPQVIAVAPMPT